MCPLALRTGKGDAVLFDTRILHRGGDAPSQRSRIDMIRRPSFGNFSKGHRMLLSVGYGAEHNAYTDAFERGIRMRNELLASRKCGYSIRNECATRRVAADLKREPAPSLRRLQRAFRECESAQCVLNS